MTDIEFDLDTILKDLRNLEQEIEQTLSSSGVEMSATVSAALAFGYGQQLEDIRFRLGRVFANLNSQLAVMAEAPGPDSAIPTIRAALADATQLNALIDRLHSNLATAKLRSGGIARPARQLFKKSLEWVAMISAWIKRISGQLWNLLCRLVTPKEWKMSGGIGTGPFGLADVSVEITFGP